MHSNCILSGLFSHLIPLNQPQYQSYQYGLWLTEGLFLNNRLLPLFFFCVFVFRETSTSRKILPRLGFLASLDLLRLRCRSPFTSAPFSFRLSWTTLPTDFIAQAPKTQPNQTATRSLGRTALVDLCEAIVCSAYNIHILQCTHHSNKKKHSLFAVAGYFCSAAADFGPFSLMVAA